VLLPIALITSGGSHVQWKTERALEQLEPHLSSRVGKTPAAGAPVEISSTTLSVEVSMTDTLSLFPLLTKRRVCDRLRIIRFG
jgi:hypothetical protein